MTELKVEPKSASENYLYNLKKVTVGEKTVQAPIKTVPLPELETTETILSNARGINEFYLSTSEQEIKEARTGASTDFDELYDNLTKARPEEINLIVVNIEGDNLLDRGNLQFLAEYLNNYSNFVICPLMSQMCDNINAENGTQSESFNRYLENMTTFLDVISEVGVDKPVLGTLPAVSKNVVLELFDEYAKEDIEAFCFDFMGKKITARERISSLICPLMKEFGQRQLHRNSLWYAINAYRGKSNGEDEWVAEDFFSFGVGFDILGGIYEYPYPDDFHFPTDNNFRIFRRNEYQYEYADIPNLHATLPSKTGLNKSRVEKLARQEQGRLQSILKSEQMNLALNTLREAIRDDRIQTLLESKKGTTNAVQRRLTKVKDSFDEGRTNPKLGSF